MDKIKEKMKKFLKYGSIFVGVFSLYFSGLISSLTKAHDITYNPFAMIRNAFKYGFSIGTFGLFFIVFELLLLAAVYSWLREHEGMDKMGRLFKMSQDRQTYGDSHFEDPEEFEDVALVQTPEKAYGTILGQMDDTGRRLINYKMHDNRINTHMAVLGASGSGKSYTFTKPYCYQAVKRRESVIITDPDGGLYRDMAGYFQDNGYVVRRLDFANLLRSDGWDCLSSIHQESAEIDAQIFAQAIISNLVDDMSSIYAVGPMSLLKAVLLYVVLDPDRDQKDKNISEVYNLIQNPGGEDFLDSIFDPSQLSEAQEPARGPYQSFKTASPNLRGNLITNLTTQLQLFQNKLVCEVLSTDDIDLVLPGKQPCAYFCIFPDYHYTYKFLVSLFFSMMFMNLTQFADNQPNGRLPVPVNFLLDEFRAIGKLPDWDTKMATIRKRGMNAVMIFQDITQLQMVYEKDWENILSNCSTLVCLGINAPTTADMVSRRVGETSVEVQTQQHQAAETFSALRNFGFVPHSTGEGRRSLLTPEELYRMDKDDSLIIFQGHNPIWARKYPHVLHPESKKLRTILPQSIPSIHDKEARAAAREEENQRVAAYLEKHPLSEVDRSYADVCEPEPKETTTTKLQKLRDKVKHIIQKAAGRLADKLDDTKHNEPEMPNFTGKELFEAPFTFELDEVVFNDAKRQQEEEIAIDTESAKAEYAPTDEPDEDTIIFEPVCPTKDAQSAPERTETEREEEPAPQPKIEPAKSQPTETREPKPMPKVESPTAGLRYRFVSEADKHKDMEDGSVPPGKRGS